MTCKISSSQRIAPWCLLTLRQEGILDSLLGVEAETCEQVLVIFNQAVRCMNDDHNKASWTCLRARELSAETAPFPGRDFSFCPEVHHWIISSVERRALGVGLARAVLPNLVSFFGSPIKS